MVRVVVNGEEKLFSAQDFENFGTLLKVLLSEGQVLKSLKINGKEIPVAYVEELKSARLDEELLIEVETQDAVSFLEDTLLDVLGYIQHVKELLPQVASNIRKGREEGWKAIEDLSEGLSSIENLRSSTVQITKLNETELLLSTERADVSNIRREMEEARDKNDASEASNIVENKIPIVLDYYIEYFSKVLKALLKARLLDALSYIQHVKELLPQVASNIRKGSEAGWKEIKDLSEHLSVFENLRSSTVQITKLNETELALSLERTEVSNILREMLEALGKKDAFEISDIVENRMPVVLDFYIEYFSKVLKALLKARLLDALSYIQHVKELLPQVASSIITGSEAGWKAIKDLSEGLAAIENLRGSTVQITKLNETELALSTERTEVSNILRELLEALDKRDAFEISDIVENKIPIVLDYYIEYFSKVLEAIGKVN
ncbi:hypothetical protein SAMN04488510_10272 [Fervidobacterium changbaicum]|uniref:hypothetical protein n=1 Tax=Fervidobacterium changbaicum TaxID=310769 RepID=UPI0008830FBD|nr:hypothetical protein [Fervidobacterium changbaicum]SDG96251.1 hypothetical protein SAMN04488510_10272 [Fervidobacterium changbaicum]